MAWSDKVSDAPMMALGPAGLQPPRRVSPDGSTVFSGQDLALLRLDIYSADPQLSRSPSPLGDKEVAVGLCAYFWMR